MASDKTVVIERIWQDLQAEGLGRMVVCFDDVTSAINSCNVIDGKRRSAKNPANFMKDLLRGNNASKNWPASLAAQKITGRQVTGIDRIFEFIPFGVGQVEPFPNPFEASGLEKEFVIQSVSLPITTKKLGRQDEAWLIQVAVQLRLLETHFATVSAQKIIELTHLQTNVKLNRAEIDGLFLAVMSDDNGHSFNALVTCEAKQQKDPILGDQIIQQVASAYASVRGLDMSVELFIPIAIKALKDRSSVYVAEFEPWTVAEASAAEEHRKELVVGCSAVYRVEPPVPGIGYNPPKPRVK